MNNDPLPGSAASPPSNQPYDTTTENSHGADEHNEEDATGQSSVEAGIRRRKVGLAKKLQFMTHLMSTLDMLVFVEICTLYYLDCSFFRLVLRSMAQYMFLTPKSEELLLIMPSHRPSSYAIFGPNIICILLHVFSSLPTGTEGTRGYLHGGVIIDFIGQKAPSSKLYLLLLDLVVLGLQCFMMSAASERERIRSIVVPQRRRAATLSEGSSSNSSATAGPVPTGQDHDAEERGVHRDGVVTEHDTEGLEMRPVPGGQDEDSVQDHPERSSLLAATTREESDEELYEVLRSGNAIIADFHVLDAIRAAGNDYEHTAAVSLQNLGYTTTLVALAAERRAQREARRRQRQEQQPGVT